MARTLKVDIIGDASSLERSFKSAGVQSESFGSKLGGLAKTAGLLGGAAALGGVAIALDKSIHAAIEGQVSQAALNTALKATHQSVTAMTPALEKAQDAGRKLGFGNDDARQSLAKLEIATGSTKKAISDLGVAEDIARFKHTSLTAASQMLAQAMTGSQRAAKQLGISVPPVTANVDALKRSHENLTTAVGRADLAHAMLQDKLATGNAVIQAVTDKVKGQAQAFSDTAAGGMAQFHAQLQNLEEKLGNALLPTMERVLAWVNTEWPTITAVFQTVSSAIGQAIDFVKPYFEDFVAAGERIAARVRADWPQIHATIETAMNAVRDVISGVVNIAEALWAKFGSTITDIAKRTFAQIGPIIRDAMNIVVGIIQAVGDLLHGRWGKVFDDLGKVVSAAFDGVKRIIITEVKNVAQLAYAIGKAIVDGIISGLGDIASSVGSHIKNGLSGAVHFAGGLLHGSGEYMWTKHAIGEPMAHGVIEGWKIGIAPLKGIVSDNLDSLVVAANQKLRAGIGNLKQYAQSSLLDQATNYLNQQATDAANAQTISDYQAAIFANQAGINHSGSPDDRLGSIPGFANGGVVPGPMGAPQLIVAHGGETVTPPGKSAGMVVNITVNGDVSGDELVQKVVQGINRMSFRQGQVLVAGAAG